MRAPSDMTVSVQTGFLGRFFTPGRMAVAVLLLL